LRRKSTRHIGDRTAPKKNLRGVLARIGLTGKYYCGSHAETFNFYAWRFSVFGLTLCFFII